VAAHLVLVVAGDGADVHLDVDHVGLVFTPARQMLGEKVVCVADHAKRATLLGSFAMASSTRAGSRNASLMAGSTPSVFTKPCQSSST